MESLICFTSDDCGKKFENSLIRELQKVFGYKKTHTTPYRPQGNSVLERFHSTMQNMLAMYCDVAQDDWTEFLPFVQMAHNTAYHRSVHETPHYLMFGRMPDLPIDIIMGVPQASSPVTAQQYAIQTVQRLQLAYELARQNLQERQQAAEQFNLGKRFLEFDKGDVVLIYHPHYTQNEEDSNKLLSPWRGPYTPRSRLSPVVLSGMKVV